MEHTVEKYRELLAECEMVSRRASTIILYSTQERLGEEHFAASYVYNFRKGVCLHLDSNGGVRSWGAISFTWPEVIYETLQAMDTKGEQRRKAILQRYMTRG